MKYQQFLDNTVLVMFAICMLKCLNIR